MASDSAWPGSSAAPGASEDREPADGLEASACPEPALEGEKSPMTAAAVSRRWTCSRCAMAVGRIDGEPVPLPESWELGAEGSFCLTCRRQRAAEAAQDGAPTGCSPEARAKARRAGLIEFEVRRTPTLTDGTIARACRTSTSAVAAARAAERPPAPIGRGWPPLALGLDGSVQTGIALALVAALMANLASLLKHRGCQGTAPVRIRQPLQSARGSLDRDVLGRMGARRRRMAGPHRLPLDGADLPRAGDTCRRRLTLAVMSQRLFGAPVERRQWLALFLGGAGLALLAVTVPQFSGSHSAFAWAPILGFEGGLALIAAALALGHRAERLHPYRGILLAALAGTLFALAGVATKGLTGAAGLAGPSSPAGSRSSSSAASSPSTPRSLPFSAAAPSRRSA